jgi:hypothetical protein
MPVRDMVSGKVEVIVKGIITQMKKKKRHEINVSLQRPRRNQIVCQVEKREKKKAKHRQSRGKKTRERKERREKREKRKIPSTPFW